MVPLWLVGIPTGLIWVFLALWHLIPSVLLVLALGLHVWLVVVLVPKTCVRVWISLRRLVCLIVKRLLSVVIGWIIVFASVAFDEHIGFLLPGLRLGLIHIRGLILVGAIVGDFQKDSSSRFSFAEEVNVF